MIQGTLMGPINPSEDGTAIYPTASLEGGYHTILITVTDSEGLSSAQSIHVDIQGEQAIELLLLLKKVPMVVQMKKVSSVVVRDGIDDIENLNIEFTSNHSSILGSMYTRDRCRRTNSV